MIRTSMRRLLAVLLSVAALVAVGPVLANGLGGDAPPASIPVPAAEFSAFIEDTSGTRVRIDRLTFNGEIFVYGSLGGGQASVPFARIRDVVFAQSATEAHKVLATATVDTGDTVTVEMSDDLLLYGHAVFGNYQIAVEHIRRLEIIHP